MKFCCAFLVFALAAALFLLVEEKRGRGQYEARVLAMGRSLDCVVIGLTSQERAGRDEAERVAGALMKANAERPISSILGRATIGRVAIPKCNSSF